MSSTSEFLEKKAKKSFRGFYPSKKNIIRAIYEAIANVLTSTVLKKKKKCYR